MRNYKIGIDLDGVIFDYITGYNGVADDIFGLKLPPYDRENYPKKWNWMGELLTKEQDKQIRKIIHTDPTFWEKLQVYPWAINLGEYLWVLDEVYFITSRTGKHIKYQTEISLQNLGISSPTVLIVPFALHKTNIVNGLHLDIMIEDKPETLSSLFYSCPHTTICRLIQPWNHECLGLPIYNLQDFLKSLNEKR